MSRRRARATHLGLLLAAVVAVVGLANPLLAAVRGTVRNATSGQPAGGVMLTLSSFKDGMAPVDETVSAADGSFVFQKDLPAVAAQQSFLGAIRAEHDGVGYTEILRSGSSLEDIQIVVYSASAAGLPAPTNRVIILEPARTDMMVREGYQFVNDSEPPVTYSSESGTLRFYLPPTAEGSVQVSTKGPAGMPLRSTALPAGEPDVFKVDFPMKPGENSIELTYVVPREDAAQFTLRAVYLGVPTTVAVPEGVQLDGDIQSLGREPTTQASLYAIPDEDVVILEVNGEGRLPSGSAEASSAPAEITIEPAPVADEILWIVTISALILGLGFFHLLTSKRPAGHGGRTGRTSEG